MHVFVYVCVCTCMCVCVYVCYKELKVLIKSSIEYSLEFLVYKCLPNFLRIPFMGDIPGLNSTLNSTMGFRSLQNELTHFVRFSGS